MPPGSASKTRASSRSSSGNEAVMPSRKSRVGIGLWRPALSLSAGAALAFTYPAFNVPLLGWIALAGLLFAILGADPAHAALCGWFFGAGFYAISLSWICVV